MSAPRRHAPRATPLPATCAAKKAGSLLYRCAATWLAGPASGGARLRRGAGSTRPTRLHPRQDARTPLAHGPLAKAMPRWLQMRAGLFPSSSNKHRCCAYPSHRCNLTAHPLAASAPPNQRGDSHIKPGLGSCKGACHKSLSPTSHPTPRGRYVQAHPAAARCPTCSSTLRLNLVSRAPSVDAWAGVGAGMGVGSGVGAGMGVGVDTARGPLA
jgi:hypothetical protein